MALVDLGYHNPGPHSGGKDPRHRLLYLPGPGLVIAVESRTAYGWRCEVIAARSGQHPAHLDLTHGQVADGRTEIDADPVTGPDMMALLWQTRLHQRWRNHAMSRLGRIMTESLRPPGSLTIELTAAGARQLALTARLRTPALRLLLHRLTDAGMLTTTAADRNVIAGTYTLALPEPARAATSASAHPHGVGSWCW